MANDVKWIKMMVGMFDGMSFKKIKRAKIGGESFRDKLTAIWFELMDFAGRCNHGGAFVSPSEIPFTELSDIATMIDRDEEELRLCMAFYLKEGMITIIDDVYSLTNWAEYQNKEGLDKIREQTRKRVAKHRENKKLLLGSVTSNVTVTQGNAIEEDIDKDKEEDIDNKDRIVDCQQIVDLYHSICISFPSVRSLSDSRKKAIKARLRTYSIDDFKTVFANAEASSFLKGGNERNWSANFDWLIKDSNMTKILEGQYADKPKRYGRKEPVPGWMGKRELDEDEIRAIKQMMGVNHEPGEAEKEAIRRMMNDDHYADEANFGKNVGNDPELADRAEKLKQQLQGG